MTVENSGMTTLVKPKALNAVGEALVKRINKLNQVLQDITQVLNFIKACPMKHKLFTLLCNDMGVHF